MHFFSSHSNSRNGDINSAKPVRLITLFIITAITVCITDISALDNISWSTNLTHQSATQTSFLAEALTLDANGKIAATGKYRNGLAFVLLDSASGDTLISPVYYGAHASASMGHDIFSPGPDVYIISGFRAHETISTRQNLWVLKIDQKGDTVWTKTFSPPWNQSHSSTVSIGNGEFFVGSTWLDWNAGSPGYAVQIIKMNVSGDSLWMRTIATGNEAALNALHALPDGSVLCAGETDGNAFICAIDTAASLVWQKTFSFSENDIATDITSLPNGTIVVVGQSKQDYLSPVNSTFNSWVMLLGSNGDSIMTWHHSFSQSAPDGAGTVVPCNSSNGFFVAGQATDNRNRPKWWVASFDSTGDTVHTYLSSGGGVHDAISVGGGNFILAVANDYSFSVSRIGNYCTSITRYFRRDKVHPLYQRHGDLGRQAPLLYQLNGRVLPQKLQTLLKTNQCFIDLKNNKKRLIQLK